MDVYRAPAREWCRCCCRPIEVAARQAIVEGGRVLAVAGPACSFMCLRELVIAAEAARKTEG